MVSRRAESVGYDAGSFRFRGGCASCEEEAGISWVEESETPARRRPVPPVKKKTALPKRKRARI
jgi:hypothetical protein